ncbi:MAG TPA: 4-hydroxythreonine-4-phosphate dehydrogenase PdxA [Stellaceae bacterium]
MQERGEPRIVLLGDERVIRFYADLCGAGDRLTPFGATTAADGLSFLPVDALEAASFRPGISSSAGGKATIAYIEAALGLVDAGRATAIVAGPHSEKSVNAAGIPFSGYPSLLARLKCLPQDEVFLMLVGGGLRIVHVTLHERLQDALTRINSRLIEAAVRAGAGALRQLGIESPKLGIFGINPHAGENGLFGDDDARIIEPSIATLKAEGYVVEGPVGADLMVGRSDLDAFVAMYHDQGHVPVKLLAGRNSAAMSIGAGLLFSTVGHGCAFDIAGRNVADCEPVLRSLRLMAGATHLGA